MATSQPTGSVNLSLGAAGVKTQTDLVVSAGRQNERSFVASSLQSSSILPGVQTNASRSDFSTDRYTTTSSLSRTPEEILNVSAGAFARSEYKAPEPDEDGTVQVAGGYWDSKLGVYFLDQPNRLFEDDDILGLSYYWYWGLIATDAPITGQLVDDGSLYDQYVKSDLPFFFDTTPALGVSNLSGGTVSWGSELRDLPAPVLSIQNSVTALPEQSTAILQAAPSGEFLAFLDVSTESPEPYVFEGAGFSCAVDYFIPQFTPALYTDQDVLQFFNGINVFVEQIYDSPESTPSSPWALVLSWDQNERGAGAVEESSTIQEARFIVGVTGLPGEQSIFSEVVDLETLVTNNWYRIQLEYDGDNFFLSIDGELKATVPAPVVIVTPATETAPAVTEPVLDVTKEFKVRVLTSSKVSNESKREGEAVNGLMQVGQLTFGPYGSVPGADELLVPNSDNIAP